MMPLLFIIALIIFVVADILIRYFLKRISEKKIHQERAAALETSLRLDFSHEAKTLKRATVENPKARFLCVDDEAIVLDSFRKILVMDGYSVDTVESGPEALNLIRAHHYDFVFTDLKMPEMQGDEVSKAVKHVRPDIDVVIITGYATVESAVECMKYGAMDYIQKPFTESELLDLVKKLHIRRIERIRQELKPRIHITPITAEQPLKSTEFSIPGGVFISDGHCWLGMEQDGTVKVGIDDFAKKLLGKIEDLELPNLGMSIKRGQTIFSVKQGSRTIPFNSPVSGRVAKTNGTLKKNLESLEITPYEKNWICTLDADDLDVELPQMKIGKAAVSLFQDDIDQLSKLLKIKSKSDIGYTGGTDGVDFMLEKIGQLDEKNRNSLVQKFLNR